MKRLSTLILITISFCAAAQTPKTLVGTDPEEISGFGGVLVSLMTIDGKLSSLTGGGGAVIFDNTFYLGAYGQGQSLNHQFNLEGVDYSSNFKESGFWMGYIIRPVDLLHFGVDTKIGWGEITNRPVNSLFENQYDDVFIVHPQVFAEINLSYWFKANAGLGYHKSVGVDDFYYDSTDFDGMSFSISLLFGWFR